MLNRYFLALILALAGLVSADGNAKAQSTCTPATNEGVPCISHLSIEVKGDNLFWNHKFQNICDRSIGVHIKWLQSKPGRAASSRALIKGAQIKPGGVTVPGVGTVQCNSYNCDGGSIKWWPKGCAESKAQWVDVGTNRGSDGGETTNTATDITSKTAKLDALMMGTWQGEMHFDLQWETIRCIKDVSIQQKLGPNRYVGFRSSHCRRQIKPGGAFDPGTDINYTDTGEFIMEYSVSGSTVKFTDKDFVPTKNVCFLPTVYTLSGRSMSGSGLNCGGGTWRATLRKR